MQCPRRGEICVDWCAGCPYRAGTFSAADGGQFVRCTSPPDTRFPRLWPDSPLREVPDLWS